MWLTLAGGIFCAAIDCALEFLLTDIQPQPGCAAIGCFVSANYQYWWGVSNTSLEITVVIFTCIVGYYLRKMKQNAQQNVAKKDTIQLVEANRLSFGILICGIIFQMIPSSLVFLCTLAGFAIFKSLGPFYILGLTVCGVTNSFIYIGLHAEIKSAAKYAVGIKKGNLSNAGASIMPTATARTQITRMTNVVNTERAANRMVNNFTNK
uniref:G-protein coupled receptors family 1 profile domain-containing protein n=1 Tax=Acrobeloides nanus TaxID=290746 RepID=A0A914C7R7_9BILA